MKKLFFSLVALMVATVSFAQNTLVATLRHGEEISMYYGIYALQNAMKVAQSGDVINLSGGVFQATDITKGVTLRGTGVDDAMPTSITGNFTINVASSDTCRLSMEGIRVTGRVTMVGTFSNPYFLKCLFDDGFFYESNSSVSSAMYVNCETNFFSMLGSSTVQFVNCFVNGFWTPEEAKSSAFFLNCYVLSFGDNFVYGRYVRRSLLINCVFGYNLMDYDSLPSTTTALNCVGIDHNYFQESQLNTNCKQASMEELFADPSNLKKGLTDEAKTIYLGNDGTEVGIYGGMMPWDLTPSYPRITKMNVANRTTADGKLSVEIEVSASE